MKTQRKIIIFLLFSILSVNGLVNAQDQEIDFKSQWDTVRVLKNPYKGWYHHLLDNGTAIYAIQNDSIFESFPGMDHLYLRLAWSYLEPQEGKFDWHYIDDVVKKYVPRGYKISFRITCSETGGYPDHFGELSEGILYATPSWVQEAGAKGVIHDNKKTKTWIPKWDDPVFLAKLDQFHKAFARRYDGQPWVRYVDIGSIGDWGEGHTTSTTNIPITISEVKASIDIYLKYYKKSQLVLCYGYVFWSKPKKDELELFQYALSKGITLRSDSSLVGWYLQNYLKTWTVSHPHYWDPLYIQKPIVFEMGHYRSVKRGGNWLGRNGADTIEKYGYSGATIMRKAIETMHATYIGYHGYAEDWLADNPDLTKELANLCGYWYFPGSASFPSILNRGENELSIIWFNKGIAPAYNEFHLILRFESEDSKNSFNMLPIYSGNKSWLPGISKTEKYQLEIPLQAPKGGYRVKFKLVDQAGENSQPVQVGLKESAIDTNGFVELGKVEVL